MDARLESALARCPVEIWRMILWMATHIPPQDHGRITCEGIFWLDTRPFKDNLVEGESAYLERRLEAQWVAWCCARVSRAWYDICYPFVLEWVFVGVDFRSPDFETVTRHRHDHRGRLVKSLYVNRLAEQSQAPLLSLCSELQSFTYSGKIQDTDQLPDLLSYCAILAWTCARSLRVLDVRIQRGVLPLNDICRVVMYCENLEKLVCFANYTEIPPDSAPPYPVPLGDKKSLALKSIWWNVWESDLAEPSDDAPIFFRFLLQFHMPFLEHIGVAGLPSPMKPYLLDVFRECGPQLRCVQVAAPALFVGEEDDEYQQGPARDILCAIIRSCPNLVLLEHSLGTAHPLSFDMVGSSLRYLVCTCFIPFNRGGGLSLELLEERINARHTALKSFCSEQFPALEIIRLRDLQPQTLKSQRWPDKYGYRMPSQCVWLLEDLWERCRLRGIRLEDCTGELVNVSSFSPTREWYAQ